MPNYDSAFRFYALLGMQNQVQHDAILKTLTLSFYIIFPTQCGKLLSSFIWGMLSNKPNTALPLPLMLA